MDPRPETLNACDYEECLAVLKLAFHTSPDRWVEFEKELPKAFRPKQELMEQNLVIRENGKIAALVGVYPFDLVIGGKKLPCGTIGNVATHPDFRNRGYMKLLFTECVRRADEAGLVMTRLGGLRQRYNRYGYELAGEGTLHTVTARNTKAAAEAASLQRFTFVPMENEAEFTQKALDLHASRPFAVDRIDPETFLCVLKAHYMEPFALLNEHGDFAGFVTASADRKTINELRLTEPELSVDAIDSWLRAWDLSSVSVYTMLGDPEAFALSRWAELPDPMIPSMFRVRDFAALADALLSLRQSTAPMPDTSAVIGIEGWGSLKLEVSRGNASCFRTDEAPELVTDRLTATRLLFGPAKPAEILSVPPALMGRLSVLLPLPLTWSMQDNV